MKKFLVAAIAAVAMVLTPTVSFGQAAPRGMTLRTGPVGAVWGIFGCTGGIIVTAMAANWQQNRQLTLAEAATCGLLFWSTPPKSPGKAFELKDWSFSVDNKSTIGSATGGAGSGKVTRGCKTQFLWFC